MPRPDLGLGRAGSALLSPSRAGRRTHVPFPPTNRPRFLLPRYPAPAASAAVRTSTTPGSVRSKLVRETGQFLVRLGLARLAPRAVALGGPGTILHHLQEVLDQELVASVHLGPPRANRKPVLHLMDLRGRSVAFAKLGMNEFTCRRVRAEAEALRRLGETETHGLVAPDLLDVGQWQGLDYLVMRPLATDSGLTSTFELRARATGALVDAFPTAQTELEKSPWWLSTVADLERCGDDYDATTLRAAATRIVERYGDVPVLRGAGHGDFSPWNVCAHVDHLAVWDWERFALHVPVGWDEIHFTLNAYPGGAAAALAKPVAVSQLSTGPLNTASRLLLVTYLLNRGVNYVIDGQLTAGAQHGPLAQWLLPALVKLLEAHAPE